MCRESRVVIKYMKKHNLDVTEKEIVEARTDEKKMRALIMKCNYMMWFVVNMYYQPKIRSIVQMKGDLYGDTVISFVDAVHRWKPKEHAKFFTYAVGHMRSNLSTMLRRTNGIIKTENSNLNIELPLGDNGEPDKIKHTNATEREIQRTTDSNSAQKWCDAYDHKLIADELLKKLKPKQRELVKMRYGLGDKAPMKPADIADSLSTTTKVVSARLCYALTKMKKMANKQYKDDWEE